MSKFTVRVIGTLKFDRELTVYAADEDAAGVIAQEMMDDAYGKRDEVEIGEIYVNDYDKVYEISVKSDG